jgi:hypothetical protein
VIFSFFVSLCDFLGKKLQNKIRLTYFSKNSARHRKMVTDTRRIPFLTTHTGCYGDNHLLISCLCLKILFLVRSGRLRAVKTLEESAYEPPAVSLRRGIPENVFTSLSLPDRTSKYFIGHTAHGNNHRKKMIVTFCISVLVIKTNISVRKTWRMVVCQYHIFPFG